MYFCLLEILILLFFPAALINKEAKSIRRQSGETTRSPFTHQHLAETMQRHLSSTFEIFDILLVSFIDIMLWDDTLTWKKNSGCTCTFFPQFNNSKYLFLPISGLNHWILVVADLKKPNLTVYNSMPYNTWIKYHNFHIETLAWFKYFLSWRFK